MGKWGTEEMAKDIFGEEEEKISKEQLHEMKIEIMKKYAKEIQTDFNFYIKGNIPSKKIDNAIAAFAVGLDRKTIIGFYDLTVFGSGKEGILFTDDAVYCKAVGLNMGKWVYSDMESVEYGIWRSVIFYMKNGESIKWDTKYCNGKPLTRFFNDMLELERKYGKKQGRKIKTKVDLMQRYGGQIVSSGFTFYIKGTIPEQKLETAISRYANGVLKKEVIGLLDTSLGSAKQGYVFTEEAVYQNANNDGPHKLRYEDISDTRVEGTEMQIEFKDGSIVKWRPSFVEVQPFANFLKHMADWQE